MGIYTQSDVFIKVANDDVLKKIEKMGKEYNFGNAVSSNDTKSTFLALYIDDKSKINNFMYDIYEQTKDYLSISVTEEWCLSADGCSGYSINIHLPGQDDDYTESEVDKASPISICAYSTPKRFIKAVKKAGFVLSEEEEKSIYDIWGMKYEKC